MKKFATLVLVFGLGFAVAHAQMRMVQQVIGSGAAVASNSTMLMWGTIGQGVIGPTGGASNIDYQGFWHLPAGTSGIEIVKTGLPGDYQLFQNYPNPFNATTSVKFSVPAYSHIVLRVISMTGAVVKTLVDENYSAGEYKVDFTAGEIPTGSYLYTLEAGGHMMTKRMILIH